MMNFERFSRLTKLIIYSGLLALSASILVPIFWMTYTGFKTKAEIMANPFSLPQSLKVINFVDAWKMADFTTLYANTLTVTLVSVLGLLIFCSAAGYAFAHFQFKGHQLLFIYFLIGMMIPPQIIMIPGFKIMSVLSLRNSLLSVIFTYLAWVPFGIFFFRAYFLGMPKSLIDASRIDGASELRIFWQIFLPLAKPAMVTVGVFYFVWIYSDFLWPLIYLQETDVRTVTMGMMYFEGRYTSNWHLQMAALSIATWPPVLFYLSFRNQIQKGLVDGALKM